MLAMIMRTSCCLNLPPPPPTSNPPLPINPPQVSLVVRRRQCFCVAMGVACSLIGVEMENFNLKLVSGNGISQSKIAIANVRQMSERMVGIEKWSEKRACPSWRHNSLETIVPENLPRPKARRRYEAVDHSNSLDAPPLTGQAFKLHNSDTCFSM